ncbi:MAG: hypothetical protein NTY90_00065, partial [Candidatus Micrarchaeota archaeon]|nr:hypothetical protein [Candidatus Micrarchaeota archaeon]
MKVLKKLANDGYMGINFESALPSKNIQILLFIIGRLKRVEGRVKLFKLHHLVQVEGKIKFDCPDEELPMGYAQYSALNSCIDGELVLQTTTAGFAIPGYNYELTKNGQKIYEYIFDQTTAREKARIIAVLQKYSSRSGTW